jgi:UDP-glucose 4-epimerase
MRVLITGGAGFIGSHLCDALVAQGDHVVILDNLSTGSKENIAHLGKKIKIFDGDIRDQKLIESLTSKSDLVFHMAAALGVDNILENPQEAIATNFHGSEVVLNAATKFNKRILIASTSEIYGKNLKQPLSEGDDRVIGSPQKFRWSYSDAKALEEAIAHFLFLTKKLKVTTIRFFNTVGPRQIGKYGMVIPRFVKSAIENEPINIFGNGSQTRVFCHVSDSVRALIMLSKQDKSIGEVVNLGGIGEISILELAKIIIRVLNSRSKIQFQNYDQAYSIGFEEMQRRVPDISKLQSLINWKPQLDIESIIKDVAENFY